MSELYNVHGGEVSYDTFENIVIGLLDQLAPTKEKYIRANTSPFMNKALHKAIMKRSRLKNLFLKKPCQINSEKYKQFRNYCTSLFRKQKKSYYSNLDTKPITDNEKI